MFILIGFIAYKTAHTVKIVPPVPLVTSTDVLLEGVGGCAGCVAGGGPPAAEMFL